MRLREKIERLGKIPKYVVVSLKIYAAGTGTRVAPFDREQPIGLFCMKITKLHCFLRLCSKWPIFPQSQL